MRLMREALAARPQDYPFDDLTLRSWCGGEVGSDCGSRRVQAAEVMGQIAGGDDDALELGTALSALATPALAQDGDVWHVYPVDGGGGIHRRAGAGEATRPSPTGASR